MAQANTRIKITVPQRSYEAIIESGLLENAGLLVREVLGKEKRLFVVTVEPVRRRWGKQLSASLVAHGFAAEVLEMKDGERSKKLASVEHLAEQLTRLGAVRNAAIFAFGGGVIGDVAGF